MPRGCELLLLALLVTACGATTSGIDDDPDITTQVKIALLADAEIGARRLDVKTFQRVVTLGGTVRSDVEAARAVSIARRVRGVRDVKSELKVDGGRLPVAGFLLPVARFPSPVVPSGLRLPVARFAAIVFSV